MISRSQLREAHQIIDAQLLTRARSNQLCLVRLRRIRNLRLRTGFRVVVYTSLRINRSQHAFGFLGTFKFMYATLSDGTLLKICYVTTEE